MELTTKAVLVNDTSIENHYGCIFVVESITQHCKKFNIEIVHKIKLNENWNDEEHLQKILNSDIVIVNGEGSIHSSNNRAQILSSLGSFCRANGKKSYLINSVYHNNDLNIAKNVKNFDLIFVRESKSQKELSVFEIKSSVVPDVIFGHDQLFKNREHQKNNSSYILYSDSVIDYLTLKLYNAHTLDNKSHFTTMRVYESNYLRNKNYSSFKKQIKNILTSIGILKFQNPLPNSDTYFYSRKERYKLEKIYKLHKERTDFVNEIKKARMIFTGRFHMVCLAIMAGVSFYAIPSNTHKIQGLLNDIGLKDKLLNPPFIDIEKMQEQKWSEEDFIKADTFFNNAKNEIYEMFRMISKNINEKQD